MTLGQKQRLFTKNIGLLIGFAYANGYELTGGDWFRSSEQASENAVAGIGIANSLHTKRLAMDFNLFKNGRYLTATEDHKPLGEYWKTLHPMNRWGGAFGDGNHYSMEHQGIR